MTIDRTSEKFRIVQRYSNPSKVIQKAKAHGYDPSTLFLSPRSDKKYMIVTPDGRRVHFGAIPYEDFTKHKDAKRRQNYLTRSGGIQGTWKSNRYAANTLSRTLLW
jgi:hypothetical protein